MDSLLAQAQADAAWIGGLAGIVAAAGVAVVNFYTARAKLKTEASKAAADIKFTAARAAVEQKAQAERTAVEAWQKIADYHECRVTNAESKVGRLQEQNEGQQRQIDVLKSQVCDLKDKHDECLENHKECEEKHAQVVKRLNTLEDTVRNGH